MKQQRLQLNGLWVLAAMLLLLHFAIWKDFGSPLSRSLMLAHLGLFFIWQPLWRRDQRIAFRAGILFVMFTTGFIYWMNWWILCGWIVLLIGLVSGQILESATERRAYLLTLIFLVSELLIRCVTELFQVPNISIGVYNLFKYGLITLPFIIIILTWKHTPETQIRPIDFFRGITVSMIAAMLAVGSLLNMYYTGIQYPLALFQSLLALSVFLFVLSWLSSPIIGFSGLTQLWERSLMNIGTPFEKWLGELAQLAEQEKIPNAFVNSAMEKLVELPWIEGVRWQVTSEEELHGLKTKYRTDLSAGTFDVSLYTHRAIGPTLLMHCKLLIQLVHHFHTAKNRELEMMQQTHLQAIYETGARVTHDIKNLLQSLQTITSVLESDETLNNENPSQGQLLLKKQLPYITQRMQLALDKLRDPEDVTIEHMSLQAWWKKLQNRIRSEKITCQAHILSNPIIPFDLFDSVIENLLENATFKGQTDPDMQITISLMTEEEKVKLSVCDSGEMIKEDVVEKLLDQPLDSNSGLGIGLYQAARQAELNGFKLKLVHNESGRVCFQLSNNNLHGGSKPGQYNLFSGD